MPSKNGINNQSQEQQIIISGNYNKKTEYLAFKLDRLRDKAGRYERHKSFLEKCITENVIPNLSLNQQSGITMKNSYHVGTINYNRFQKNL